MKPAQCAKAEASLHLQQKTIWALGSDCRLPHSSFTPASQLSAIHVHCSTVLCLGSLGPGGPIIEAGCPITALTSPACMFTFWLPPSICLQVCLSIVEVGSCTPRGPASAPPLSLFRVQAAAMLELLAMLMDPFICH